MLIIYFIDIDMDLLFDINKLFYLYWIDLLFDIDIYWLLILIFFMIIRNY